MRLFEQNQKSYMSEEVMVVREDALDQFQCEGFRECLEFQEMGSFRVCQKAKVFEDCISVQRGWSKGHS